MSTIPDSVSDQIDPECGCEENVNVPVSYGRQKGSIPQPFNHGTNALTIWLKVL